MRSSTPFGSPLDTTVEDSPTVVLPSCKELFRVCDLGKRNLSSTFPLPTHSFHPPTLPLSPRPSPPFSDRRDYFQLEDSALSPPPSPPLPRPAVAKPTIAVVPYVPLPSFAAKKTCPILPRESSRASRPLSPSLPPQPPSESRYSMRPSQHQFPRYPDRLYRQPLRHSRSYTNPYSRPINRPHGASPGLPSIVVSPSIDHPRQARNSTHVPLSPPLSAIDRYPSYEPAFPYPPPRPHSSSIRQDWLQARRSQKEARKKKHQCSYCDKSFIRVNDLNRHVCIHTGERPWICRHCERGFIRRDVCQSHESRCPGL